MYSQELYVAIAKAALGQCLPSEDTLLACMIVLHTCDFVLKDDCNLDDVVWSSGIKSKRLHAVTRRHAAEIIAAVTGHESDQCVIDKWYANYSSNTPYEVLESVPEPLKSMVSQCILHIQQHPLVVDVVDAD
jgi:hypothetical protein